MRLYVLNGIVKTCYDSESTGYRSRCKHSMQQETTLDHMQGLLADDFQSMMLTVEFGPKRCSHNSTSRLNLIS